MGCLYEVGTQWSKTKNSNQKLFEKNKSATKKRRKSSPVEIAISRENTMENVFNNYDANELNWIKSKNNMDKINGKNLSTDDKTKVDTGFWYLISFLQNIVQKNQLIS